MVDLIFSSRQLAQVRIVTAAAQQFGNRRLRQHRRAHAGGVLQRGDFAHVLGAVHPANTDAGRHSFGEAAAQDGIGAEGAHRKRPALAESRIAKDIVLNDHHIILIGGARYTPCARWECFCPADY